MKLEDQRREYAYDNLSRESLADSPFDQFNQWMAEALARNIQDPTAMTLSTVGIDGRPAARIVLLKGFDVDGFCFYTHLTSRKGRDIAGNPCVTLHFAWLAMDRQVTVNGHATVLDRSASEAYFATRPRESQIATWVSKQSSVIPGRDCLDSEFELTSQRFEGHEIPMPPTWGGYRVVPAEFEFWQGGEHRLHDRFRYQQSDGGAWSIDRLAP